MKQKFLRSETKVSSQWHKSFLPGKQKFHGGENGETFSWCLISFYLCNLKD